MASDVANGRGEPSATALVGMEGLIVKSQTVRDGEHWLLVQTMEPSRWCPIVRGGRCRQRPPAGGGPRSADRPSSDGAGVGLAHLPLR